MQPNTTFQKFFFSIIFVVTALMFYQMYLSHQHNMEQKPCVARTRVLLDMLTEGSLPDSPDVRKIEMAPVSEAVLDSAIFLLGRWGKESRFSDYQTGAGTPNSGYTESIRVFYPPPQRGKDPLAPGFSQVALEIQWLLLQDSVWRAKLDIVLTSDAH